MLHDYESLSYRQFVQQPDLLEAYRGVDIVSWHGRIERQLDRYVSEATDARNYEYATKLREYLKIWRDHVLTGSINVETISALTTPCEVMAVDAWRYKDYFSNLRDQLRRLKASVEELPNTDEVPAGERAPGAGSPPSDFGARETAPGGADAGMGDGNPAPPEPSEEDAAMAAAAAGGVKQAPIQ